MNIDKAKEKLTAAEFTIISEQRANNDLSWQLRLSNGGIVNVFDTGKSMCKANVNPKLKLH